MTSTFKLCSLPEAIFSVLQLFLDQTDFRYLLYVNKKDFEAIKKKYTYYRLNDDSSYEFCIDESFRRRVLGNIASPERQISLFINDRRLNATSVGVMVHTIRIGAMIAVNASQLCPAKHIVCQEFSDLVIDKDLAGLEALEINNIKEPELHRLLSMNSLRKIKIVNARSFKSLSPLRDIPSISLTSCVEIIDYSPLQIQQYVHLRRCDTLRDVISFSGIHQVRLEYCDNLQNIEPLNGIYDLALISCNRIDDLSVLGGHHRFHFTSAHYEVTGYEALENIPHVSLNDCNIRDLSVFLRAKTLTLRNCRDIRNVSSLNHLHSLVLDGSPLVQDITPLQHIPILQLGFVTLGESYGCIGQHQQSLRFSFLSIPIRSDWNLLWNVWTLEIFAIDNCYDFLAAYLNHAQNLRHVIIDSCHSLIQVPSLMGKIYEVTIRYCRNLSDLSKLGQGNHTVKIVKCNNVTDVSSLQRVPHVVLIDCFDIQDWQCLQAVPRLIVVQNDKEL